MRNIGIDQSLVCRARGPSASRATGGGAVFPQGHPSLVLITHQNKLFEVRKCFVMILHFNRLFEQLMQILRLAFGVYAPSMSVPQTFQARIPGIDPKVLIYF